MISPLVTEKDATATGAEEIGQAVQRLGGTAGSIGLEFEKASSWVAEVSSRTRESAFTIGNSIKSIIARVQSLKENGFDEEDGTQVNEVAKSLGSVGIQLMDTAGNFRDFGVVMDELGAKWETLSNREQAYLATTVAGSYQSSRFRNIMEGYANSVELYEGALNSAGTAQKKFDLYQEGTEAKLTKLKNAWSGVWQSGFDTGVINGVVDALTALATATDGAVKLMGVLPIVFGAIAFASAGLSKNFRALVIGTITLGNGFKGLAVSATAAKLAIRGFLASTIVGAVFVGIGIALEQLINLFTKGKETQDEYFTNLKENVENFQETIKSIDDLNLETKDLNRSQEELNATREKMASLMPQIIDHYDSEGRAIYKTTQEVDELIKKEKLLNLERKKTLYNENSNSISETASSMDSARGKVSVGNEDLKSAKAKYTALTFAQDYIDKNNLNILDGYTEEYVAKMEHLNKEIERIFAEQGVVLDSNLLTSEISQNGSLENAVLVAEKSFKNIDSVVKNASSSIDDGIKEYENHFKSFNDILVTESGVVDKNVKLFLDNFSASYSASNNITKTNSDKMISDYEKYAKKINEVISNNNIDITKMIESGNTEELKKIFKDAGVPIGVINKAIRGFSNSTQEASYEVYDLDKALNNINQQYKTSEGSISTINKLLEAHAEGTSISAEEIKKMVDADASLVDMFEVENGQIKLNIEAINAKRDAIIDGYHKEKLVAQENLKEQNKHLVAKLEMYGIEIDAITNVTEALDTIDGKIMNEMASIPVESDLGLFMEKLHERAAIPKFINEMTSLKKQADLLGASLNTIGTTSSNRDKKDKKDSDKDKATLQDLTDAKINAINAVIDVQHRLNETIEESISSDDTYSNQIKLTNDLISGQTKELSLLEEATSNLASAQKQLDNSSSYDMTKWLDANGEATESYLKLFNSLTKGSQQDALQSLFDKYKKYDDAIRENKTNISSLIAENKELEKSLNDLKLAYTQNYLNKRTKALEKYDEELKKSEQRQSLMVEGGENWKKEEQEQIRILNEKKKALEEENNWIRERLKQNEQAQGSDKLTTEQIELLNQQLKENSDAWYEVSVSLKAAHDDWAEDVKSAAESALETIEDYYEEQNKIAQKSLDDQLDAYEKSIEDKRKLMNREFAEDDYKKEQSKLKNEELEIQRKIDELMLDDSWEAKAKIEELQKELLEKKEEIADHDLDYQRQKREDNLDDLVDAKKEEIKNEKETTEKMWQDKLAADKTYAKLREGLLNNNIELMRSALEEFANKTSAYMETIGQSIDKNLSEKLDDIEKIKNLLKDIENIESAPQASESKDSSKDGAQKDQSNNAETASAWKKYLDNKKKAEGLSPSDPEFQRLKKENDNLRAKYKFADGSYAKLVGSPTPIFSAETGGMTPAWGKGGKFLLAHEKELILNKFDTSNLLKTIDFTRGLVDRIKTFDFSNFTPRINPSSSIVYEINNTIHVSGKDSNIGNKVVTSIEKAIRRNGL